MKLRMTSLEWWAIGIATTLFLSGFAIGYLGDSAWLNRFGSLIIVVGVLSATIKISDIIAVKIDDFLAENYPKILSEIVEVNRSFFNGEMPPGYQENLGQAVAKEVRRRFEGFKRSQLDRAKWIEIGVVVFGTLVNGFGDYLLSFFKAASV